MFYTFRNNTDTDLNVIIEAPDHNDACSRADSYGLKTSGEGADWTDMSNGNGDELPIKANTIIAEVVDDDYKPTGLAHGQVVYLDGSIEIY